MLEFDTTDLYPGIPFYKPMLVGKNPYEDIGVLSYKPGWMASIKKDGYWEMLVKWDNQVYMFARSKSKKDGWYTQKATHVPHLVEWMQECIPDKTILIGEMYFPGKTSKDITSVLGCLPEKAIARQKKNGYLHYYIHDMIMWDGKDFVQEETPFCRRHSNICEYIDLAMDLPQEIEIAGTLDSVYCDYNDVLEHLLEEGEEGLVFRNENGLYLPGKRRPKEMFKVKQHEDTLDFVITGFVDPEKNYTGKELETWPYWIDIENKSTINPYHIDGTLEKRIAIPVTKAYHNGWKMGFTIGLYDGDHIQEIGKVTSGLTDELREDIAENPNKYLGQVVEVSCMSIDKSGLSLRHPVFERVRFDKPTGDCRLEVVFS